MGFIRQRHVSGEGTPESLWQESFTNRPIRQSSIAQLLANSKTAHILAPHPDDEILACGGIIQQLSKMEVFVQIVAITDGEASHPSSHYWSALSLAAARTKESELALRWVAPRAVRKRLMIADGSVTTSERRLLDMLVPLFGQNGLVIAPWRLDGHPDHEAVGRAGCMASGLRGCRFFEVPIWGWHWAHPRDGTFPWHRAVSIPLTPDEQSAKVHAMQLFCTQIEPDLETGRRAVLPGFALERFRRSFEVVLR